MVLQDIIDANPVPVKDTDLSEYDLVVQDANGEQYSVSSVTFEYDHSGDKRLVIYI